MIDLTVPVLLVAAEVVKGAAGESGKALWSAIVSAYRKLNSDDLKPEAVDAATTTALLESSPELKAAARDYAAASSVLKRASHMTEALSGARILWIDDHPEWNILERRSFESLGMKITAVETTRSALACLQFEAPDVIVSDIARGGNTKTGVEALPILRQATGAPIVFYVGHLDGPVPQGAFGITTNPVELLHLCLDAVSRSRY